MATLALASAGENSQVEEGRPLEAHLARTPSTIVDISALKARVKLKSEAYRDAMAAEEDDVVVANAKKELHQALLKLSSAQEDEKAMAGLPAVERVTQEGNMGIREKGLSTAEIAMEVDTGRFASILCVRKADEMQDKNFPSNLLSSLELFSKLNMIAQGRRLRACVDDFAGLLASGPPKEAVSMGCACVCWSCGHVGLPVNAGDVNRAAPASASPEKLSRAPRAICRQCQDTTTNLVRVTQRDGTVIPWIESKDVSNMSEDERRALDRAKARAAVVEKNGGKKPKPNEKCPCGSGKKYKKCCK